MRLKILVIGICTVIVALFVVFYVVPSTASRSTPQAGGGTLPVAPAQTAGQSTGTVGMTASTSSSPRGGGTMVISVADGRTITTRNFMEATGTTEDAFNHGLYHLDVPPSANPSAPYDITYEKATQYFNISLLAEPIGQTRVEMEYDLMTKLGISEGAMCQLNYMVSVPYWVNAFYTGKNLGFSFCPGAVVLPQ